MYLSGKDEAKLTDYNQEFPPELIRIRLHKVIIYLSKSIFPIYNISTTGIKPSMWAFTLVPLDERLELHKPESRRVLS